MELILNRTKRNTRFLRKILCLTWSETETWFILVRRANSVATVWTLRHHRTLEVLHPQDTLHCKSPSSHEGGMAVFLYCFGNV